MFLQLNPYQYQYRKTGEISLDEDDQALEKKVLTMITDPKRIKKSDKGHPDICNVFSYYQAFAPQLIDEVGDWCKNAKKGCKDCKKDLAAILTKLVAPHREKKKQFLGKKDYLSDILKEGNKKAGKVASHTLADAKAAMGL